MMSFDLGPDWLVGDFGVLSWIYDIVKIGGLLSFAGSLLFIILYSIFFKKGFTNKKILFLSLILSVILLLFAFLVSLVNGSIKIQ